MSAQQAHSFCTFSVGPLRLGVEVHRVQEVIRRQRLTRIPGAGGGVVGLMNLRGQIVTAIDLRQRLGLERTCDDMPQMNVVLRTEDGAVSLLVDKIGDVLQTDVSEFEAIPETLRGSARLLMRGAYKLEHGLLLVLNTDAVLEQAV